MAIHLYDKYEDKKVPNNNESKVNGYKVTLCGYQRKNVTSKEKEVTCKVCLSIIKESYEKDDEDYTETLKSLKRDMY